MFAYCLNNCINFADPSGAIGQAAVFPVCLGGNGSRLKMGPYDSPDEAAQAFSEYIYSSSLYIRHEYGTEIYAVSENGETHFYFNYPTAGNPHYVGVGYPVPEGAIMVAYAHTHPNNNAFSPHDKEVAIRRNWDAYVVGPKLILKKYCVSSGEIVDLAVIVPRTLSALDQNILKSLFFDSWMQHISIGCDHNCATKNWPTS